MERFAMNRRLLIAVDAFLASRYRARSAISLEHRLPPGHAGLASSSPTNILAYHRDTKNCSVTLTDLKHPVLARLQKTFDVADEPDGLLPCDFGGS